MDNPPFFILYFMISAKGIQGTLEGKGQVVDYGTGNGCSNNNPNQQLPLNKHPPVVEEVYFVFGNVRRKR